MECIVIGLVLLVAKEFKDSFIVKGSAKIFSEGGMEALIGNPLDKLLVNNLTKRLCDMNCCDFEDLRSLISVYLCFL